MPFSSQWPLWYVSKPCRAYFSSGCSFGFVPCIYHGLPIKHFEKEIGSRLSMGCNFFKQFLSFLPLNALILSQFPFLKLSNQMMDSPPPFPVSRLNVYCGHYWRSGLPMTTQCPSVVTVQNQIWPPIACSSSISQAASIPGHINPHLHIVNWLSIISR